MQNKLNKNKKIKNIDTEFLDIFDDVWKEILLKCCYDLDSQKLEIKRNSDKQFKEEILHDAILKFKRYLDRGKRIGNYGGYFFRTLFNTRMDHFRKVLKNNHVSSDSLTDRYQLPQAAFTEKESMDLTRLDFIGTMVELKQLKKGTVFFIRVVYRRVYTISASSILSEKKPE